MIDPCEGLDLHVAAGGPPFIASLERHGAVEASRSRRPVAVLNVGLMHHDRDRQVTGIGDDMALAALDLLACVTAARTAA